MKIKQFLSAKALLRILYISPICVLPFCSSPQASPLEEMAQPIILKVKNDTVIEVEDKNGKKYVLSASDKFNYECAFLHVGDTIKTNPAQ